MNKFDKGGGKDGGGKGAPTDVKGGQTPAGMKPVGKDTPDAKPVGKAEGKG